MIAYCYKMLIVIKLFVTLNNFYYMTIKSFYEHHPILQKESVVTPLKVI